ncbi:MAG: hypothetical protein JOZ27_04140, partial [Caulobacteraceae bacterium]|nr:hypothetical protein [Caulobacteraceae bacterium]
AQAYAAIFGTAPTDAKIADLLGATVVSGGHAMTRADYFALYGGDGANGIGTKAAMVGWLLAEAASSDVGTYALSNDAYLHELAAGQAGFGVNLIGHYAQAGMAYTGG